MNETKNLTGRITLVWCGLALAALTGCIGYEGGGYVGGPAYGAVYVPAPEVYVFSGYDRGHYDHDAGRRGAESRGHYHR